MLIAVFLGFGCFAGADDADCFGAIMFAQGVDDQQQNDSSRHAQRVPTQFAINDAVRIGDEMRVIKYSRGLGEADVMLGKIFSGFVFVPFKKDAVIHKFYRFVADHLIFVDGLNFVIERAGWVRRSGRPIFYLRGYACVSLSQPVFCHSAMGGG
jgi:hypothetical protein